MQVGYRAIAVGVVVVGALVAGAYQFGQKQAQGPSEARKAVAPGAVPAAPGGGALPAAHPPLAGAGNEQPEREGKVNVDKSAEFVHFRVGNRNVKDVLVDGAVVWVGTSGGVIRYDTKTDNYKLFDNRSGLLSNGVFHVSKLDGRVAVGTYGGGMSLYDEKADKWETFNITEGLGDAFVYDVIKTTSGDVWIATWSGVNRVRGGALRDRSRWDLFTVDNTKGGLPNDWVYGLAEGKNGDLWLATEGGLARFRDGKWESWNHSKGLGAPYEKVKEDLAFKNDPSKVSAHHARQKQEMGLQNVDTAYNPNYIVSLAVDRDGVVWAGTWGGGLARFDGKSWTNFTVKEGLPGNHVFMLHVDRKGTLWIGTNAGLATRKGDKFATLTTSDGLFSNTVFSMGTGDDDTLWVGSFGGVAHLMKPKVN